MSLTRHFLIPRGHSVPLNTDNQHIKNSYAPRDLRRKEAAGGRWQAQKCQRNTTRRTCLSFWFQKPFVLAQKNQRSLVGSILSHISWFFHTDCWTDQWLLRTVLLFQQSPVPASAEDRSLRVISSPWSEHTLGQPHCSCNTWSCP